MRVDIVQRVRARPSALQLGLRYSVQFDRLCLADVAIGNVLPQRLVGTLLWIAVAASACEAKADDVAAPELAYFLGAEFDFLTVADEDGPRHGTRLAAEQAVGGFLCRSPSSTTVACSHMTSTSLRVPQPPR